MVLEARIGGSGLGRVEKPSTMVNDRIHNVMKRLHQRQGCHVCSHVLRDVLRGGRSRCSCTCTTVHLGYNDLPFPSGHIVINNQLSVYQEVTRDVTG